MPLNNSIVTNLTSLSIRNDLNFTNSSLSQTLERMSSGLKINSAKDDASGCAISSKISTRLNAAYQVQNNIQRGASLLNIAQGAYQNMSDILMRLRGLSVKAMDDSYDEISRKAFEDEAIELTNQLEQVRTSTNYNGISLFNNSDIVNEVSVDNLATPETTNFTTRMNLMSLPQPVDDDSGGDIFELDSGGNNNEQVNNNQNQEVGETNLALSYSDEPSVMSLRSSSNQEDNSVALMSLNDGIAMASVIEETTIDISSYAVGDVFNIEIDGINYEFTKLSSSNAKTITYSKNEDGVLRLSVSGVKIVLEEGKSHNIKLRDSNHTTIIGTSGNDIIDINGSYCCYDSKSGNDTLTVAGSNQQIYLSGGMSSTHTVNATTGGCYFYFENTNVLMKKNSGSNIFINNGANVSKSSGVVLNNFYDTSDTTKNFQVQKISSSSGQTLTLNIDSKNYYVSKHNYNAVDNIAFGYYYDENTKQVVFVGSAISVTSQNNVQHNLKAVGVDAKIKGANLDDKIEIFGFISAYGGDGNDSLTTKDNSNYSYLYGEAGDDILHADGNTSTCYIDGGAGNDILIGDGRVSAHGGAGDDTIIINQDISSSGITGGAGDDNFEFNSDAAGEVTDTSGNNKYYINGQNINITDTGKGSEFYVKGANNTIISTSNSDYFEIQGNNNTINGGSGNDYFEITGSNNIIDGGSGEDFFNSTNSSNNIQNVLDAKTNGILNFTSQNEELSFTVDNRMYTVINNKSGSNKLSWHYENGEVQITGSNFDIIASNDIAHKISINGSNNIVEGGNKNDTITIKNGENNQIFGNRGNDTINLNYKDNGADGGIGDDVININATTNLSVNGNVGKDTININADNILNLQASDGDDIVKGKTSNSTINLGSGNNTLELIGNNNKIIGGSDKNIIEIEGNLNSVQTNGETDIEFEGDLNYFLATSGVINARVEGKQNRLDLRSADSSTTKIRGDENAFLGTEGDDEITIVGNKNSANGNRGNDYFAINEGDLNEIDGSYGRNVMYNLGANTIASNIIDVTPKPFDVTLQVGTEAEDTITTQLLFTVGDFELKFETSEDARENIAKIDKLLNQINKQVSNIGATLNRLDSIYELQNNNIENMMLRKSIIIDTDMAFESGKMLRSQILQQFQLSLLSQSNSMNRNLVKNLLMI